ncbi:hypothetical protein PARPLA_00516 [Rhodobacteraceae bacterium THAF1]|uniref:hypothetical protein n=1 Tax=Palleronia sp. THAF1 TaxID=2587842 RepID=UPI000F3DFB22|nr:hypothetical protein [Palleronia sp. THAF1]QFU09921.1 hypothetical protein FIU81_14680 [Palleronia sp. THAF1]VDC17176.1 hypothetical protein PARPLA_00516 [Rhodobacteraceae bacterium THAF1]
MTRTFAPAVALAAALLSSTAMAQETVGSIDGILDGRQVSFVVMDGEDAQTGWSDTEDGIQVTLDAYPADSPMSDENRLLIEFTAQTATRMPEMTEGTVTLTRGDDPLTATDDAIDLSLNNLEVQGESLLVTANIRVTMAQTEENVSVVSPAGVTMSADLQATVIRAED